MKRFLLISFLLLSFFFFKTTQTIAVEESQLPRPAGWINDFANILPDENKRKISEIIADLENKTGAEIAVVTISTLQDETVETYAFKLFNKWGIGKKGENNGVLILVALKERKIRIEVGYGLEPVLTDGICGDIIRSILTPAFKKENFAGGLEEAVGTISGIIQKEPGALSNLKQKSLHQNEPDAAFLIIWYGLCLLFTFLAAGIVFLGLSITAIIILNISTLILMRQGSPLAYRFTILSLLVPFFIGFFSVFLGAYMRIRQMNFLKKHYGSAWKKHWPWYYGPIDSGTGSGRGGGFGGGGGGFGGGSSGGGGASGGW